MHPVHPRNAFHNSLTSARSANICGLELAFSIATFIRVTCFSVDSAVGFDVPERVIHQAALTAMITELFGAVD